jgi:dihydrodipicolinate synthase/N-acetylneuraminate lyase
MARYPSTVMVSIVCPWDDRERLEEAIFRRAIRHALNAGFRHLYVFGTAGEGYAVDSDRFRQVVEVFGDELSGTDAHPMVGVIGLSTANVVERLAVAHGLGVRAFQISLPGWSSLTDSEVGAYMEAICGAFPDSAFMHYNTARVGRLVGGRLYAAIAARVPNLVATKTMTGELAVVAGVVRDAPELMHFLTEQSIAFGALFGDVALLGTFGALAPDRSWALLRAAQSGRHHEAAAIGSWFERLSATLFDPLMVDRRVDGAYDKAIEKLSAGLDDFPLRMLSPYRTISDTEFEGTRRILRERFPELATDSAQRTT